MIQPMTETEAASLPMPTGSRLRFNGNRYIVAIHAYGVGNPCTGNNNCGARVTQSVFNLLTAWRQ